VGTDDYGTRRLVSLKPVGSQLSLATSEPRLFEETRSGARPPFGRPRGWGLAQLRARLAGDGGDEWVEEAIAESFDNAAEGRTDDDSDGKVNNVAAHQKVLESLEHERGSVSD
jgi:hypothetical protein